MKQRFSTLDIIASVKELKGSDIVDLKVINIYDLDSKTYLIKLGWKDRKAVILFESGIRMHLTDFNWPKSMIPSNFSMKCRKHLNGKRLKSIEQLGIDRIVQLTFGLDENAFHLIIELYDRGNVILTDSEYRILQLLRRRTDKEDTDVKFAVNEIYDVSKAKQWSPPLSEEKIKELLDATKPGDSIKRLFVSNSIYGSHLLEHCFANVGLSKNPVIGKGFNVNDDLSKLIEAQGIANDVLTAPVIGNGNGYLIQKEEKTGSSDPALSSTLMTYVEFHPLLFKQCENQPNVEFPSFNKAVDEFYSKMSSQKLDQKAFKQKKAAHTKLENIKLDHEKRLAALSAEQDKDKFIAELIQTHLELVENAIAVINSAIANQIDWQGINELLISAQRQEDVVACAIGSLQLETNQITLKLRDFNDSDDSQESSDEDEKESKNKKNKKKVSFVLVKVDLDKTAHANARAYFDRKRTAADKEKRTNESTAKALKASEKKTKQLLKEVETTAVIKKARKTFWFEKFHWFISSENYLVIGGMDQQQNEILVKKYLRAGDLYIHADLSGASTVVLKNPTGEPVPPKTLNEAGTMAICYSVAWESRVVTSAWWVHHDQVSKTAPAGEYISTGSFMIRGKRNYLLPSQLAMGFGVMFRLGDQSIVNHLNDRKIRDASDVEVKQMATKMIKLNLKNPDEEIAKEKKRVESIAIDKATEDGSVSGDDEDAASKYPDTSISLQYVAGDKFQLQRNTRLPSDDVATKDSTVADKFNEARKPRMSAKQRRDQKKKPATSDESNADNDNKLISVEKEKKEGSSSQSKPENDQQAKPLKRGQKNRLKKMKEKYKDQDDEDREMMMKMIGSAGKTNNKDNESSTSTSTTATTTTTTNQSKEKSEIKSHQNIPSDNYKSNRANNQQSQNKQHNLIQDGGVNDIEDDEETKKDVPLDVLDTLTGCPIPDDELLFCIPVCAPYSTLTSYRFKAKITPGTGRRGKVAKTALQLFQASKEASKLEKDLLRSLKDVDISRNLPAKIRLQAPNFSKSKGR